MSRIVLQIFATVAFLFGTAYQLPAQSLVQISSIHARAESLTCVGLQATTFVRLQIYLAGLPEAIKGATGSVQLATYSARPSTNQLAIRDATKEFSLAQSPAVVDFEVSCTGDTLSGEIALAAVI